VESCDEEKKNGENMKIADLHGVINEWDIIIFINGFEFNFSIKNTAFAVLLVL